MDPVEIKEYNWWLNSAGFETKLSHEWFQIRSERFGIDFANYPCSGIEINWFKVESPSLPRTISNVLQITVTGKERKGRIWSFASNNNFLYCEYLNKHGTLNNKRDLKTLNSNSQSLKWHRGLPTSEWKVNIK